MTGLAPLLIGAVLWLAGLVAISRGTERPSGLPIEYWLGYPAFAFGGFATLSTFALPELDSGLVLDVRVYPLAALSVLLLLRSIRTGVFTLAGVCLAALSALYLTFGVFDHSWQTPLLSAGLLAGVFLMPEGGFSLPALKAGARHATALFLLILALVAAARPADTFGVCRLDKCSAWGVSLGPVGTGNAVGLALAAMAIVTLMQARTVGQFLLVALGSALLVDLTSARSAAIMWGAGAVLALALAWTSRRHGQGLLRVAVLLTSVVVAVLPFGPWSPSDFTDRAALWAQALRLFEARPLFGYGPSFWVNQPQTFALDANYATHNLMTEMLVSGGLFGTALFVLAVAGVLTRPGVPAYGVALVGLVIGSGLTEVVSAPGRIYILPGLLPFVLLCAYATPVRPVLPVGAGTEPEVEEHSRAQHSPDPGRGLGARTEPRDRGAKQPQPAA